MLTHLLYVAVKNKSNRCVRLRDSTTFHFAAETPFTFIEMICIIADMEPECVWEWWLGTKSCGGGLVVCLPELQASLHLSSLMRQSPQAQISPSATTGFALIQSSTLSVWCISPRAWPHGKSALTVFVLKWSLSLDVDSTSVVFHLKPSLSSSFYYNLYLIR